MKAGINRRQFMQKSLVGAAAVPLATHVLSHEAEAFAQAVSPNDRIQVGIIGVGARIQGDVLAPLVSLPGVEVTGVCDAYKGRVARAQERLGAQAKEYPDYRALLADKSIDAVVIATPDHWHKQMAIDAFAAGKDVYLEKPMTYAIDDGPQMIAAAEKSGRILQIGSQGISSKLQQTAREIIKSGKLGQISMVRASYDRNTDSGAWLYPIPPDADPKTVNWEMFLGPAPQKAVRPRAVLPVALLLGLLRRHLDRPVRAPDDDDPPRHGRDRSRDGRGHGRQLPPPEDPRGAGHPQRLRVLRQGGLHGLPQRHLQQLGRRRERLRHPRPGGLARVPRGPDDLHARAPGGGQRLDRRVVALEPREGLLGRPGGAEARDAGHLAAADGEPGRDVDRGRSRLDAAPPRPTSSTRCAPASPRSRTATPGTTRRRSPTW